MDDAPTIAAEVVVVAREVGADRREGLVNAAGAHGRDGNVPARAHMLVYLSAHLLQYGPMKKKQHLVPITHRALFQRVNRVLTKKGNRLRTYRGGRGGRWWSDLGNLYIIDVNRNTIVRGHCDLEKLGKELGVLAAYERLDEEAP
jgi:hypothetical protein